MKVLEWVVLSLTRAASKHALHALVITHRIRYSTGSHYWITHYLEADFSTQEVRHISYLKVHHTTAVLKEFYSGTVVQW